MSRPFLTAEWRWLAMLNYGIDPSILTPHVPANLELDTWNGTALITLLGMMFYDARVLRVGVPFHRDFEEVNLRFYVRRNADDGVRRGVVFIKELVPRRAIAAVARWVYGERYESVPMRHDTNVCAAINGGPGHATYEFWAGERWNGLGVRVEGRQEMPDDQSQETFVKEHYWGYVAQPGGSTLEYRVEHPPWRIWRATASHLDCDVAALYGAEFAEALSGPPASAFLAEGSAVSIHRGIPVGGQLD